ncbi:Inner membrane protein yccF, putative [Perkinsus marinus ATCC 50983]|uniref:Inner membrane protein yccF, putative n=1 Tax=Perkinsus marinus (strain ATCC 50983 / TXsc) TaxID=423536 RepID=C5LDP7_PERM5|nr:Inner membrane protein yccF, putative [Perkinsus marinus ATCC 50983]EER05061.1 Inner membrane protein yccF, putative [Perkinsus marinus ATCC 50983]|eukprot:XP_002773245.1 Inner membrane protein yccF, putative [Perkinsus marinus ATCC 50983]
MTEIIISLGNFFWILLAGWYTALIWLVLAGVLCITIVGIPCGKQCWKMTKLSFLPFGYEVRDKEDASCCCSCLCNCLWFIPGLIIAVFYIIASLIFFISIIGIPFGVQCCKLAKLAFSPFGHEVALRNSVEVTEV